MGVGGSVGAATTVPVNSSSQPPIPPMVFRVTSGSMEPTYRIGVEVILRAPVPRVGSVVVFHPPVDAAAEECGPRPHVVHPGGAACAAPIPKEDKGIEFIKRVVAGPGDELEITGGHVFRRASGKSNFVRERDPYIRACGASHECNFPRPIKIGKGEWFLMGDNRGESDDSRFWGPVPTGWILGTVTGRAPGSARIPGVPPTLAIREPAGRPLF